MCTVESSDPFQTIIQWSSNLAAGGEKSDAAERSTDAVTADSHASINDHSVAMNSHDIRVNKPFVGPSPNDSGLGAQVESPSTESGDTASPNRPRSRNDRRRADQIHINAEQMRARTFYHFHVAEEMAAADTGERFIKKENTPPVELNLDFSDWETVPGPSAASMSSNVTQSLPIFVKTDYSSDRPFNSTTGMSFNSSTKSVQQDGSTFHRRARSPRSQLADGSSQRHRRPLRAAPSLSQPLESGGSPPRKSFRLQTDPIGDELRSLSPTKIAGLPHLRPQPQTPSSTGISGGHVVLLSIKEQAESFQAKEKDLLDSNLSGQAKERDVPTISAAVKQECPPQPADYTAIKKVRIHKRADYEAEMAARNRVVLKSCLKSTSNPSPSSSTLRRVAYALDRTTTSTFEIEDSNKMNPVGSDKVDYVRLTKKFMRVPRKKTQIFKRADTRVMRMSLSGELAALLRRVRRNRDTAGDAQSYYSRWLIADGALRDLNDTVFKNMIFTRLEYPMDSSWLLTYGLNDVQFDFEVSYVFIACGAERFEHDLTLPSSSDSAVSDAFDPTGRFLRDMHAWISAHVVLKTIEREKKVFVQHENNEDVIEMAYRQGIPVLVAITVPEEGEKVAFCQTFNEKLRQFVREFNANELSKLKADGIIALPIELLDWAKLNEEQTRLATEIQDIKRVIKAEVAGPSKAVINGTTNPPVKSEPASSETERRQESEKRYERLANELSHSYGVLIR